MKKRTGKASVILLLALMMLAAASVPGHAIAEPAAKSGKAVIQAGKKKTSVDVKVAHGIAYVPIKSLASVLGTSVVYYQEDGMELYHVYEIRTGKAIATYTGYDGIGYFVEGRKKGEERGSEDQVLFSPPWICQGETDYCWLNEAKDTGPFRSGSTLYVPLRLSAKALGMKLAVGKDSSGRALYTLK
ncbi:hypothetical protein [Saccharibacillus alkalitolerans]|uniref:Copper amine oxidase-like N-terminal domain-containing protein n=1 Tax=Saccharibacillus alkalitolerans TaxID=2705290 RepID=A0ABX0F7T4_9BACL|nr:hypothetical protein [Saccharibacillus alkalitolerans]NGZ74082.1 hypothetical protein [Saccharibacillus alkalitolerans]